MIDNQEKLLIITEAIVEGRIEVILQPVLKLPQRKVKFYECFSRLSSADGIVLQPSEFLPFANTNGLIHLLDKKMLQRCKNLINSSQHWKDDISYFCNIATNTIKSRDFSKSHAEDFADSKHLLPYMILEMNNEEFKNESKNFYAILKELSQLGTRFSLDHIKSFADLNLEKLQEHKIRYVKIGIDLFLEHYEAQGSTDKINELLRSAKRYNIKIVVSQLESDKDLLKLLDYELDFAQGFLLPR